MVYYVGTTFKFESKSLDHWPSIIILGTNLFIHFTPISHPFKNSFDPLSLIFDLLSLILNPLSLIFDLLLLIFDLLLPFFN
jgi:hypothetical protein